MRRLLILLLMMVVALSACTLEVQRDPIWLATLDAHNTQIAGTATALRASSATPDTATTQPAPEATRTPRPTEMATAEPERTATLTTTAMPDDGIITGDNLAPPVSGVFEPRETMLDPDLPADWWRWPQPVAPAYEMYFAADPYYCRRSDADGDGRRDQTIPPCESSLAEDGVKLWRPEYTGDWRCPPYDGGGQMGNCAPNIHLFCFSSPCITGWQTQIDLTDLDVRGLEGSRQCRLSAEFYIWAPDPDFSSKAGDWAISGARTPDATFDDKRSVGILLGATDTWIFRDNSWQEIKAFSYPQVPVYGPEDTLAMPFDEWRRLEHTFELPGHVETFSVSFGMDALWGWQNNLYMRDPELVCDGVYAPDPVAPATPTPVARSGASPVVEVTPLGGNEAADDGKPDGNLTEGSLYVTTSRRNVRSSPEVREDNVLRVISAGSYPAYDRVVNGEDEWAWICQPEQLPPCGYGALLVGGQEYGHIEEPPSSSIPLREGQGGGGIVTMELVFSPELLGALILTLLMMVPTLGGPVGAAIGLIVDIVKAIAIMAKKPLADDWGGRLALILNFIAFVGLFLLLGHVPGEMLPPEVAQWVEIAITVLTFLLVFLTQLKAARLMHNQLVPFAPTIFSLSRRKLEQQRAKVVDGTARATPQASPAG